MRIFFDPDPAPLVWEVLSESAAADMTEALFGAVAVESARDRAAEKAITFLKNNGLWMNLSDSGIRPEMENSINQLQELFQKKYVEEKPVYEFEENLSGGWNCSCRCDGFMGFGNATGKTGAKKAAALMVLENMMRSAGLGGDR